MDLDILIGDEVLIEPLSSSSYKIACALTPRYYIHRWERSSINAGKESIENMKKEMTEDRFRCEFF